MSEPEPSVKRLHLHIRGRVQGVFYRAAVCERARVLEVAGWIKNRPDGSVEAVAEGPQALLDAFVAFCREGPPLARVTAVDLAAEPVEGLAEFEIRY
ncbi:MAG: acylphosphatase [Planctomycetes bacterium]|nr:acylphosphatase [Planctomycetota bacterium]